MIAFILGASLLSLDSLIVCFALGTSGVAKPSTNRIAAAFGTCDAIASLMGILFGISLAGDLATFGHWAGVIVLGMYALVVVWSAGVGQAATHGPSSRAWDVACVLPILMSLDNLVASATIMSRAHLFLCAAGDALISGFAAWLGFRIGECLRASLETRDARDNGNSYLPKLIRGAVLFGATFALVAF